MPLKGIAPDPVLGAIDPVLRTFIEMGYDRTDYSAPTKAKLFPSISLPAAAANVQKTVTPAEATSAEAPAVKAPQAAASTPKAGAAKASAPKKAAGASNGSGNGSGKKSTGGSARPSKVAA